MIDCKLSMGGQGEMPNAAAPMFQPVRTRRAFEAVCDQIRRQVADGTLLPGHRLPGERELAEQFDVSRSGVRQALHNLELTGLDSAHRPHAGSLRWRR